jgi:hypothetical protein
MNFLDRHRAEDEDCRRHESVASKYSFRITFELGLDLDQIWVIPRELKKALIRLFNSNSPLIAQPPDFPLICTKFTGKIRFHSRGIFFYWIADITENLLNL